MEHYEGIVKVALKHKLSSSQLLIYFLYAVMLN